MWDLRQYGAAYDEFMLNFEDDDELTGRIDARLHKLRQLGNQARLPISKPLGKGIFSLRVRFKKVRIRFLYFFGLNNTIVVTSAFVKKQREIPQKFIDHAREVKSKLVDHTEFKDATTEIN